MAQRLPLRRRAALALALAVASASACARSSCPTSHFVPSASFNVEMTTWLAQPLPPATTDDEEILFLYTEADTIEPDRAAIFQVLVLRDGDRTRVTLTDAPKAAPNAAHPKAVVTPRSLPASLAERIHRTAAAVLVRTHFDPVPPRAASAPDRVVCTDGFWAYAAVGQIEDNDLLAGEVYTPATGTEAGAIVALGRALHRYAQGRLDEHGLEAPLAAAESHARP